MQEQKLKELFALLSEMKEQDPSCSFNKMLEVLKDEYDLTGLEASYVYRQWTKYISSNIEIREIVGVKP